MRDMVRGIQNLRKESGFEVTDRINIVASGSATLKKAFDAFSEYIMSETLATKLEWTEKTGNDFTEIEAGEETWKAKVARAK